MCLFVLLKVAFQTWNLNLSSDLKHLKMQISCIHQELVSYISILPFEYTFKQSLVYLLGHLDEAALIKIITSNLSFEGGFHKHENRGFLALSCHSLAFYVEEAFNL